VVVSEPRRNPGELLAAISNIVVGVYADCLGRGPTRARSYMDQNVVLCLLEDTLTPSERALCEAGQRERLLELRIVLNDAMRDELTSRIEKLLGREVKALVSGTQLAPDVASEVFVLGEPLPDRNGGGAEEPAPAQRGQPSERLTEER